MAYNPLQNTKIVRNLYKTLLRRSKELDTIPKGIFTWPSKIHKYWNEYDPHQSSSSSSLPSPSPSSTTLLSSLEKDGKISISSTIQTSISIATQTSTQTHAQTPTLTSTSTSTPTQTQIQTQSHAFHLISNQEALSPTTTTTTTTTTPTPTSTSTSTSTSTPTTTTTNDRFTARIRYAFKKPSTRKRSTFMFNGSSNISLSGKKDSLDEWTKNEFQKCFDIVQIINRTIALGSDIYQHKILRLQFILHTWTLLAKNPEQFRQKFVPYDEHWTSSRSNAIFGAMLVEAIHFDLPLRQHIKNTLQVLHEAIIQPIQSKNPRNIQELNQILFEEIFTWNAMDVAPLQSFRERLNIHDFLLRQVLTHRYKPVSTLMLSILYPYIYEQIFGNRSSEFSSIKNKQLHVLWVDKNTCVMCEPENNNSEKFILSENDVILNIADGGICSFSTLSEFYTKYIQYRNIISDQRIYGGRKWVETGHRNNEEFGSTTIKDFKYLKEIKTITDKDLWLQLTQNILWYHQRATVPKEKQTEHALLIKFWLSQWTHLHFNPHATNTMLSLESGTL